MAVKYYTKEELVVGLKNQIYRSNEKAVKALIEIYNRQTASEQDSGETRLNNGVGFTGSDAGFLTSIAQNYLKYHKLSEKQYSFVRTYMQKYARQLIDLSIYKGLITKEGRGKYYITANKTEDEKQPELDFEKKEMTEADQEFLKAAEALA